MGKEDNPSSYAFYRLEQGCEDVLDGRTEEVAIVKTSVRAQGVSKNEKVRHRKCYTRKVNGLGKGYSLWAVKDEQSEDEYQVMRLSDKEGDGVVNIDKKWGGRMAWKEKWTAEFCCMCKV